MQLGRRLSCTPTRPYTNRSPPQTMSTAAPPFLPSLDLDMGMFPASNLPEQLPIDFTTVPTSAPSQPWGGGEEGGGEGAAAVGSSGRAGDDGGWPPEGELDFW